MSILSRRSFLGTSLASLLAHNAWAATPFRTRNDDDPTFDPSILFLTWHRDPTTTMDIIWVAAKGESPDSTVYFAPASQSEKAPPEPKPGERQDAKSLGWQSQPSVSKPYPMADLSIFKATLAGLAPGTDYEFHIGRQSPLYRFRTMPAKATNTIHFVSGGDCGVNQHMVANCIQAARQDPMFALIGGDLGYDNGVSVDTSLAFLRNYTHHMIAPGGRLIPMVTCIGNHEVQGGFNQKREKAPFYYALFDDLYPDTGFATLDFGDYLSLVLLDSGHTTPIAGAQANWLENTLKARIDLPHVFAVNHVPAYPSARKMFGEHGQEGTGAPNRKHWTPLFDKYRLPVVLEHHDHTFKRSKLLLGGMVNDDGVLYLGDGSWGRLRAPRPPEKIPLLARVSQNFHLSQHRLEGQDRFHLAFDADGRVMDVCRSGQRKKGLVSVLG